MLQPLNEHLIFGMTLSKFRPRWDEGVEGEDEREVILKDLKSHLLPEHKVFCTVNVDSIMHNTKCRSRCCEYGRGSVATSDCAHLCSQNLALGSTIDVGDTSRL